MEVAVVKFFSEAERAALTASSKMKRDLFSSSGQRETA